MTDIAQEQWFNVQPPESGFVCTITLDANSRVYDLSQLDFGGLGFSLPFVQGAGVKSAKMHKQMFWVLATVPANYAFSNVNTDTLVSTATNAAGANPIIFGAAATRSGRLLLGNTWERWQIDRSLHRYLYLLGSGAGTFYIHRASQPNPGAH